MRTISLSSLVLLAAIGLARPAAAVYASEVRAGCYIAAPNDCRVRLAPVTIQAAGGSGVVFVQIFLNSSVAYDFHTDSSNFYRPAGPYTVPLPSLDLGATCGQTYVVAVIAQDTLDPSAYVVAGTDSLTCPTNLP